MVRAATTGAGRPIRRGRWRSNRIGLPLADRWNTLDPRQGNGDVVERKVATAGFPYPMRYRVTTAQLIVMAVYHQRRRPDFGVDRLP